MQYRIIQANNMKQAMIKIHQEMGPNALIYRTRNRVGGIEVLAGLPEDAAQSQHTAPTIEDCGFTPMISKADTDLDDKLAELNNKISSLSLSINQMNDKKKFIRTAWLASVKYIKQLINLISNKRSYALLFQRARDKVRTIDKVMNSMGINKTYSLLPLQNEVIDDQSIRALVGPTGVGKTTTIIKLAVQFSTKYDLSELGIISTNIDDLYIKNKLNHFCEIYNVNYIHINSLDELNRAIDSMATKRMILIDTHGISQRDVIAINKQATILKKSNHKIDAYLTLSASQQPEVIEDTIKHFTFKRLKGCILTKVDEALRIEPSLEAVMKCKLPVSYVCNGEDLDRDIYALSEDYQSDLFSLEKFTNIGMRHLSPTTMEG